MSAFRCQCGRGGHSLDDFPGHKGMGFVRPVRRTWTRDPRSRKGDEQ